MVFSGIVEEVGMVEKVEPKKRLKMWDGSFAEGFEIRVRSHTGGVMQNECYIGCSIAVNGTCLTVTDFGWYDGDEKTTGWFTVNCSGHTLEMTNLGDLTGEEGAKTGTDGTAGFAVNLESAARADARLSGHMVQGHVDGCCQILAKHFGETGEDGAAAPWGGAGEKDSEKKKSDHLWVTLSLPDRLRDFVVEKGYVALDGTSLTVCNVRDTEQPAEGKTKTTFQVMLIAHTQGAVTLPRKNVGDRVNIECDAIGKSVVQVAKRGLAAEVDKVRKEVRAEVESEFAAKFKALEDRLAQLEGGATGLAAQGA